MCFTCLRSKHEEKHKCKNPEVSKKSLKQCLDHEQATDYYYLIIELFNTLTIAGKSVFRIAWSFTFDNLLVDRKLGTTIIYFKYKLEAELCEFIVFPLPLYSIIKMAKCVTREQFGKVPSALTGLTWG